MAMERMGARYSPAMMKGQQNVQTQTSRPMSGSFGAVGGPVRSTQPGGGMIGGGGARGGGAVTQPGTRMGIPQVPLGRGQIGIGKPGNWW
jgi:hypothetical protein